MPVGEGEVLGEGGMVERVLFFVFFCCFWFGPGV